MAVKAIIDISTATFVPRIYIFCPTHLRMSVDSSVRVSRRGNLNLPDHHHKNSIRPRIIVAELSASACSISENLLPGGKHSARHQFPKDRLRQDPSKTRITTEIGRSGNPVDKSKDSSVRLLHCPLTIRSTNQEHIIFLIRWGLKC